jgi:hypothetical protein
MDREQLLSAYDPEIRDLAEELCQLILRLAADAQEQVYPGWKNIQFGCGMGRKNKYCAVEPGKGYINLYFLQGVDLPDPQHLLEGTGKKMRHVKLRPGNPIPTPAIEALLHAAVEMNQSAQ